MFESALQLYTEVNFQLIAETKFDFTATYAAPTNDTHILITNTTSNTVEEFQVGNGEIRKTSKEFPKSRSPPTFITVSPSREFSLLLILLVSILCSILQMGQWCRLVGPSTIVKFLMRNGHQTQSI